MNLRCIYCQTPFTLSRPEMLSAIILMNEKGMNHYDGHCPRCRRANSISRQRMELFFPNWQDAAKKQASSSAKDEIKAEPISKAMKTAIEKPSKGKQVAKAPAKAAKKSADKTTKPVAKKAAEPKPKKK